MSASNGEIVLYHWPQSRSTIVRWMLEEVGVPYRIETVDITSPDHPSKAFLALNPMGKVPVLRHGDTVISEVSAICCYLADRFPEAGLAPAIDDPRRGPYLKWLFFAPSCIEPAVMHKSMQWPEGKRGMLGWANYDVTMQVLADAAIHATPWILGKRFSAADVVIGAQVRWGFMFGTIPKHPALEAYAHRLAERPALKRQMQLDGP
ncbi:MAG TPA: glutathione S-transferase family protein [Hyphomicrobiaceae bacterium]|nr:glutathione S-transferase family protein [Hyphomicrobiaceae bacterium]